MKLLIAAGVAIFSLATVFSSTAGATPPLAQPSWTTVPYDSIDPQIAAGPNHVVISQNSQISIFDKSGTQLSSLSVSDFFASLWDPANTTNNINDSLNLPSGTTCYRDDPMTQKIAILTYSCGSYTCTQYAWNYCLNTWYDTRTLYDESRDRFVVVALARNEATKCDTNPTGNLYARRTKIVVAYSQTADPTAGWYYKWFDGVPGESCTTTSCKTEWGYTDGDAADYPSIALVERVLMVSVQNKHKPVSCDDEEDSYPEKSAVVHVWNANALSSDSYTWRMCGGICSWSYYGSDLKYYDGSQVGSWVAVAHTHGDAYLHHGWFAQPDKDSPSQLDIWHFAVGPTSSKPTLYRTQASIVAFDTIDRDDITYTYSQPATAADSDPAKLQLTFTKSMVMRDQYIYYADVGGMNGSGSKADASIRLTGLIPSGSGVFVSYASGRNAIFNVDGEGYGSPAIEVDAARTIVLTYSKFGVSASNPSSYSGFGARYLTWTAGNTTAPTGQSLADNEDSMPKTSSSSDSRGKFDNAGISLDPSGRVYMMQPYVKTGPEWGYAVNFIDP